MSRSSCELLIALKRPAHLRQNKAFLGAQKSTDIRKERAGELAYDVPADSVDTSICRLKYEDAGTTTDCPAMTTLSVLFWL